MRKILIAMIVTALLAACGVPDAAEGLPISSVPASSQSASSSGAAAPQSESAPSIESQLHISVWYGSSILPTSQGVVVMVENDTDYPATFSRRFGIKRMGSEEPVDYLPDAKTPTDTVTQAAHSREEYSILLTDLVDGQAEDVYRVVQQVEINGEVYSVEGDYYTISPIGERESFPLPPEMTPQNQEYCEKYIARWGFYSPFEEAFDETQPITKIHTYLLYSTLNDWESAVDVSADEVEGLITAHFDITPKVIRSGAASKSYNPQEYYDPDNASYHFEGGYGGGSAAIIVTDSEQQGDLLTLTCAWYGMQCEPLGKERIITLRLGPDGGYKYIANRVML